MTKLLQWNVCSFNKNQMSTIHSALSLDADITMLQEVTPQSLEFLKTVKKYEIFYTAEKMGKKPGYYLVTLSKSKYIKKEIITYYSKPIKSIVSNFLRWHAKETEVHEALLFSIYINNQLIHFCNVHLSWPVSPRVRIEQLTNLYEQLNLENTIISGDLNTFGGLFYYNFLTALFFGYKPKDIFINERKWLDQQISKVDLQNPFRGSASYTSLPINAQLDHILLPSKFKIINTLQLKDTVGSDHTPYIVEFQN